MIVKEFGKKLSSSDLNDQLAGVYKWRLNLKELTESDAKHSLNKFQKKISNIKNSSMAHFSERNPVYMEAVLASKVLETWLNERAELLAERTLTPTEIKKRKHYISGIRSFTEDFQRKYGTMSEQIMFATATKMAKRQSVDEAMDVLKGVLSGRTQLNEGEVDQASVIVAARGMVDEIQKMLENISSMVNEELPPLMDTIRDRVGQDQASAFGSAAQNALTPLLDACRQAREAMDNAARSVAGEAPAPMDTGTGDMASGGETDLSIPPTADLSDTVSTEAPPSEADASDAAVGGDLELGRGKRF